ncbi:hypothetical protein IV500_14585 [Paeniglutamicibacter antarcticus]|uniref:Uncharacterized protein n=1 Tax=Arthrobacter terrae TaxID=2935737 RepID=A0A931CTF6_9MICC|nr:hypothetical protein [Arthrobacter terrae]MBG0740604.1 hypothetical protein [Arthrobacter terrae]
MAPQIGATDLLLVFPTISGACGLMTRPGPLRPVPIGAAAWKTGIVEPLPEDRLGE